MKMTLHRRVLPIAHPFTIARSSIENQLSLVVELEHEGMTGLGEVTADDFYGHTLESMESHLHRLEPQLDAYCDQPIDRVWEQARQVVQRDDFALSAFDMALHDLRSRIAEKPLFQYWGLTWTQVPTSSYTIGIDTIPQMIQKLRERPGWPIYKIKLGTQDDLEIIDALRRETDAIFRVDANCGWSAIQTIEYSARLAERGVEFIEQPLSLDAGDDDFLRVYHESALPIIADESCQSESDIQRCAQHFHGVNIKLCKCGGLTPALRMLREARKLGLRTMVGCMVESSVGISGAAHLLPLLDYADLDGAVLLQNDPAEGVTLTRGQVQLANSNGTGARLS